MRFLLHGSLSSAVHDALIRNGHSATTLAEAGIDTNDALKHAGAKQLDIVTNDADLACALFENGIGFSRSIVFLQLEGGDVEQDDAIDRLFDRYKRLTPGRLYTVTGTRVKIRQLPRPVSSPSGRK